MNSDVLVIGTIQASAKGLVMDGGHGMDGPGRDIGLEMACCL